MTKTIDGDYGIHWFRRDLRIPGNKALHENRRRHQGRVLGFFSFDSKFLSRDDFSHHRFAFFIETLKALREDLRALGGDLLVVDCLPQEAYGRLLEYFDSRKLSKPKYISFNRDYEPFARERDRNVQAFLESHGITVETFRDHLIIEPEELLKKDKTYYKVYSPFAKVWFERIKDLQERVPAARAANDKFTLTWDALRKKDFPFEDALEGFAAENSKHVTIQIPNAGHQVAMKHLREFKAHLDAYQEARNFPSAPGTSRLSIYLKNGSLTTAQVLNVLGLNEPQFQGKGGSTQYAKEIVWREFYYHILYHRPDVEHGPFLEQYKGLSWAKSEAQFKRWWEGTTGYPIVDAGMRQLNKSGWQHNRMRMVTASFLVKDLLLDYRLGENYFMKMLLDGDLAANNGGWQWSASTGVDPQPYFRVFNPWLQSKKYDPDGDYIRHWVPELRDAPAKVLHAAEADRSKYKYPKPMVPHGPQKVKAIAMFKAVRAK